MLTQKAIDHYGGVRPLAEALGISTQAIYKWPRLVPEGKAYKLQAITGGKLKVKPDLYRAYS